MGIDPGLLGLLLALGACGGFLAGLLGIGGGMVLVPALVYLFDRQGFPPGMVVKMAIATSLATIAFTSLSSLRAHHRRGAVRWSVVRRMAPGLVVGSIAGAQLARRLPADLLALMFAVFVSYSAAQMFLNRRPRPTRQLPAGPGMFGAGAGIGVLSSLVGAGGGFVSVPFMTWCNVAIHEAVGTSAALGFPIAAAGTLGYVVAGWNLPDPPPGALGYLWLPGLLSLVGASIAVAPAGAWVAHRLDVNQLKRVFALMLFALAAYMAAKGLHLV